MSHYFINDPTLDHELKTIDVQIKGTSFRFYTDRGVFSKSGLDFGSKLLLETIQFSSNEKIVIDMGCGYGPMGIYAAKMCPKAIIHMVDVNERALDLALKNAELNHVNNTKFYKSHLFEEIDFKADLIITNPPIRAGKVTIFDLYEQAQKHLNSKGKLILVIQKKQGAPSTFEKLKTLFKYVEILSKDKGYWIISSYND
ncbi:MAG: class I SAM-dependent methyltransferase [Acholeplasmataceae bacterium]|nr:class I SAM-dependent methyltransferase [Acholeplasmataceae bacterium]MDD4193737.1 class I SAM-dependent methyltransferase [Acholeplasmataceae bacterium]